MVNQLDDIVGLVTGSLVLFSSIGLFALTLNTRYTHSIGRVRDLYDEIKNNDSPVKLTKELEFMVHRCHLLKWSFGLLLCSGLSSGLFLLCSILIRFMGYPTDEILLVFIILSVLFIFSSMIFLFMDVLASLKATLIHIHDLK